MSSNVPPPPPPGGGYPPPGGGVPPPPPPGGGYPPPGGAAPGANGPDVGGAISWAFSKFGQNAGVLIAFAAVIMVVQLVGYGMNRLVNNTTTNINDCSNLNGQAALDCINSSVSGGAWTLFGMGIASIIISLVFWVLVVLAYIGLINASLKITNGEKPEFSDLWNPKHFWMYIGVAIVFGICYALGLILCIIPGLLILWAWQFSRYVVLDTGMGVFASLGESWRLVSANKGTAVLTLLVTFLAGIVIAITCGIGALVVAPFETLFMANMYRQFQGRQIAA